MREGSLDAPTRHALAWREPDFYDLAQIEAEMERVFDICHGCRRCFNLCDSFPRLFDMIDEGPTGELDGVPKARYGEVVEACTLCDMCFMTKCPYVPPHEFDLDFPHLMLRWRAAKLKAGELDVAVERQLAQTDRNGALAGGLMAGPVNWASAKNNMLTRPAMEMAAGVDRHVELPSFAHRNFVKRAQKSTPEINREAPGFGRKAVVYATCHMNYSDPDMAEAARAVLAHNGVETEIVYPECCGMPYFEHGAIETVADKAKAISRKLKPYVQEGWDVIALMASCGLMMKFEWPLILGDDLNVKALSKAVYDIDEYVVAIAKEEGLAPGMSPIEGPISMHLACHARAQNMGPKGAEMLRLIPEAKVNVVERCSGHGGTFGVRKGTHEVAMRIGKPAAKAVMKGDPRFIASECPLAAKHLVQVMGENAGPGDHPPARAWHPIELMAMSYGLRATPKPPAPAADHDH